MYCMAIVWERLQRLELGQEGWLKQPVANVIANHEQRRPIMAGDQGSHQGHQYSKTLLTGEPGSI